MVSKKFVIENEQGLHMRPAGVLAKAVTKFESDVTIVFEDKKINAKSLLTSSELASNVVLKSNYMLHPL